MTKKKKCTVITIDAALHAELRAHCIKQGLKVGFFAEKAVREMLVRAGATRDPRTWKIKNDTFNRLCESWKTNFDFILQ